jgi:hypothetical protein
MAIVADRFSVVKYIVAEICALQILRGFDNYRYRLVDFFRLTSPSVAEGTRKKTVNSFSTIYRLLPLQHSEMPSGRTGWWVDHVFRTRG